MRKKCVRSITVEVGHGGCQKCIVAEAACDVRSCVADSISRVWISASANKKLQELGTIAGERVSVAGVEGKQAEDEACEINRAKDFTLGRGDLHLGR